MCAVAKVVALLVMRYDPSVTVEGSHVYGDHSYLFDSLGDGSFSVEADGRIRAAVLTGNGRAFSAGGSFDEFERFRIDFAARRKAMRQARRLVDEMLALHVPIVAAVNGAAVGLGATLMSLCDIVFIADTAFIADPHVSVALVAGDGPALGAAAD